jgi:REP element-mobilizing transposase RayT
MARKIRIEYPGAIYHLLNRGDRQEPIFEDDTDQERFLETLAEACLKTGWLVHAYCLLGNHFHLVVETPQANLVAGMQWLLSTYTARFNRRHRRFGHLFSGRYKSLIVDGSGTGYLRTVCDYVHLNPVRAKLLTPKQALREYRWSSFAAYLKTPSQRPAWLRVDRVLGEMGIPKDSVAGRRRFEEAMEERRAAERSEQWKPVRQGWCLGEEPFRKELLEQVHKMAGAHHYGEEISQSAEEKARRIIAEELTKLGWKETDLGQRRKGDVGKAKIARRLRRETTVGKRWIAQHLAMGSVSNVTFCLRAGGSQ